MAYYKSIYDDVSATDAVNTSVITDDGETMVFGKSTSDVLSATELIAFGISLLRADTISIIDSGHTFLFNYSDPTYFAEEYVGEVTTF